MAATLTAGDNEMTHFSFPIEKSEDTEAINPADGTPDLRIWGKATDGTLDSDLQVVDPDASLRWIKTWYDTKANIRMAHDPRKPVGKGIDIDGHYVGALIADPVAKHLVRSGVLNDFSVGICMPDIRVGDPAFKHLDPQGKAVRGVITDRPDGLTGLGEISIVDRGSNYGTQFQLMKAAADGSPEFVGKMHAPDDVLAEATAEVAKDTGPDVIKASLSFSPADLDKLLAHRKTAEEIQAGKTSEPATVKAEAGADEAGGDNAEADQADEPAEPDMKDDDETTLPKAAEAEVAEVAEPDAMKAAEAAVYKRDVSAEERKELAGKGHALSDGSYPIANAGDLENAAVLARSGHGDVSAARALIAKRAKELGVANPLSDDDKVKKAAKPAKPAKGGKGGKMSCPECGKKSKNGRAFCFGCGKKMTPDKADDKADKAVSPAAGAVAEHPATVPAHREPDGAAMEHLETDAHMADGDEAREISAEHASGPPAAEDAMGKMPDRTSLRHKSLGVPRQEGILHDLLCPAFSPDDVAKCHPDATIGEAADTDGWQAKALDAAASAPLDEAARAQALWQGAVTLKGIGLEEIEDLRWEAHKAFSDANPGPGTFPTPAELHPSSYNRPYLSGGHASASQGQDGPNTAHVPSAPMSVSGLNRGPLTSGHEAVVPGDGSANGAQPAPPVGKPSRTFYRNTSRDTARSAMASMHDHIAHTFPDLCPMHGPGSNAAPAMGARPVPVPQGAPGARKDAEPEVVKAGKMPKAACPCGTKTRGKFCPDCGKKMGAKADKAAELAELVTPEAVAADTEVMKAAIAEALAPFASALKEQGKLIDEMASAPDPRYAPFKAMASGGVLPKAAASEQVGVIEKAARSHQETLLADLRAQWRESPDPAQRLAAEDALNRLLQPPAR